MTLTKKLNIDFLNSSYRAKATWAQLMLKPVKMHLLLFRLVRKAQ